MTLFNECAPCLYEIVANQSQCKIYLNKTINFHMQKGKMAVRGGLTNSCEKKRSKKQRRKGKIQTSECRVPKNSKKR